MRTRSCCARGVAARPSNSSDPSSRCCGQACRRPRSIPPGAAPVVRRGPMPGGHGGRRPIRDAPPTSSTGPPPTWGGGPEAFRGDPGKLRKGPDPLLEPEAAALTPSTAQNTRPRMARRGPPCPWFRLDGLPGVLPSGILLRRSSRRWPTCAGRWHIAATVTVSPPSSWVGPQATPPRAHPGPRDDGSSEDTVVAV